MPAQSLTAPARRRPTFTLPPASVDAHCHVFGPGERFPYRAAYSGTAKDAPKDALAALHARLGIQRAIVVQAAYHGSDNRAMLDAVASDPLNRRGIAIVDDDIRDAELERLHDLGVRGVRYNLVRRFETLMPIPGPTVLHSISDRIKPFGWHIVLHIEAGDIPSLRDIFSRLTVPFVIDHMARIDVSGGVEQPAFRELIGLFRDERCWIKVSCADRISSPPYASAIPFARALVDAKPQGLLWGTDFPHPNVDHDVDEADLVDLLPLFAPEENDRRYLLVENPARLFRM